MNQLPLFLDREDEERRFLVLRFAHFIDIREVRSPGPKSMPKREAWERALAVGRRYGLITFTPLTGEPYRIVWERP